jgi:hypothetical protein
MAIGIVGDAGVRANAQQPKLFVGMILILIFAEALALYGLIGGCLLGLPGVLRMAAVGGCLGCGWLTGRRAKMWRAGPISTPAGPAGRYLTACATFLPSWPAVGIILASKAGTAAPMS